MLYTESMEMASPLAAAREEVRHPAERRSLWATLENRWAQPVLDLGLCLGSHSVVVASASRRWVFPARVAVREGFGKRRAVAFGPQALEIEGREPEGVTVCRPLVSGTVVESRLATQLVTRAFTAARHGVLNSPRVAVAVPSDLSAVESQALVAVLQGAGVRTVHLVEQTLAAAVGCGRDVLQPEGHLVIQVGAGVTHVSVISLASAVLSRTLRVGGDVLNQAIRDHLRQQHQLAVDDRVAEQIKRELGSALPPLGESSMMVSGRDLGAGKPREQRVTAEEIYAVMAPWLERMAHEVRAVVAEMPAELLADVHQNGVILSGGLAELRRLDEFFAEQTRLKVRVDASPEEAVSRGLQRLLQDARLRQAVLGVRPASQTREEAPEGRRSGLLGGLILASALAFSTYAWPQLSAAPVSALSSTVGSALTPAAPVSSLFLAPPPGDLASAPALPDSRSELEAENQRLRKLLKAPLLKASYRPLPADVVARDPRGWMSSLTLNVGADQGLAPGMPVTDGSYLVGRVSRVEPMRSQVRLFTDPQAVVAARLIGKKGSGVLVGSGGDLGELRYLDPDSGVAPGDWVVTSGHDGVYPAGLRLGWVTQVTQPSGQNTLSAKVRSAMNLHHLQHAVVLRKTP